MELRLPLDKLQRLFSLLTRWRGRSSGLHKDLESLVGTLQHASRVVRPGRTFMRRIFNLLAQTQHFRQHFVVLLNAECKADIEWWFTTYNGAITSYRQFGHNQLRQDFSRVVTS